MWWEDPRRTSLIGKLGNPFIVDGIWWNMVRQAQSKIKTGGSGLLSKKLMKAYPHWEDFLDEGLLELRGEEVYVAGSEEHMAWLKVSKQNASAGGKLSAKRPRDEKGRLLPKGCPSDSKPRLDVVQATPSEVQPSSSSSGGIKTTTTTTNSDYITQTYTVEQIDQAYHVWNETRATFDLPSTSITPIEQNSIMRAFKSIGLENVLLALEGQRFEPGDEKWHPKNHLRLDRVLHRDAKGQSRWETFRDLALLNRSTKSKEDDEAKARYIAEHGRSTL